MPAIPSKPSFLVSGVSRGEALTGFIALHDYLTGILGASGTPAEAQSKIGALMGAGVLTKSSAYALSVADRGKLVQASGTWTLTLPTAATVGAGFCFGVANTGAGTITIDPDGTQTIDGAQTYDLLKGTSRILVCTGTAWVSMGGSGNNSGLLRVTTITTSGTWVKQDDVKYIIVVLVGGGGGGQMPCGGAGGGGFVGLFSASQLPSTVGVTIGPGGLGGVNPTSGGTTSFGSLGSATGGSRGEVTTVITARIARPVPGGNGSAGGLLSFNGEGNGIVGIHPASEYSTTFLTGSGSGGRSILHGFIPYTSGAPANSGCGGGGGSVSVSDGKNGGSGVCIVYEFGG